MNIFFQQIKRNLVVYWRKRSECWQPLLFFVLVCVIFPLSMSVDLNLLRQIGVAVVWVSLLLSTLLTLPLLFKPDFDDGSLEQCLLSAYPLSFIVLAKVIAAWIAFALPLILATPLVGFMFGLPMDEILMLILSLMLASPILYLVGAMIAALTVGLTKNGLLLALLLLPLYVPVLIFAANAVLAEQAQQSFAAPFSLLGAMLLFSLVISPYVSIFELRLGIAYGR